MSRRTAAAREPRVLRTAQRAASEVLNQSKEHKLQVDHKSFTALPDSSIPIDDPPPYTSNHAELEHDISKEDDESFTHDLKVATSSTEPKFALSRSGTLFRAMKELVEVHDKVMEKRIGMEIQESNYQAQWKHTSDHLSRFLVAASAFMSTVPTLSVAAELPRLTESYAGLQHSVLHLQRWQSEGKHDQHELTRLEGLLNEKEEAVYRQFREIISPPAFGDALSSQSEHSLSPEQFSESSEKSDPMEHDYYDKIGELRLIRENIYNTDADQKRRRLQREFELRSGEYVPIFNVRQLFEEYAQTRERLIQEYFDTKQEMEELRRLCQKRGIEVASPNLPPLDLSRTVERPPTAADSLKISDKWNPDRWLLFGGLDKRHRVLQWRDNVNKAIGGPTNIAPMNPSPHSRTQIETLPQTPTHRRTPFVKSFEASPANISSPMDRDDPADDDASLTFDDTRADNPTSRRYSEPDTSELFRKFMLTTQSLMGNTVAKSEGGLETNDLPLPGDYQQQMQLERLTPSEKRTLQNKRR